MNMNTIKESNITTNMNEYKLVNFLLNNKIHLFYSFAGVVFLCHNPQNKMLKLYINARTSYSRRKKKLDETSMPLSVILF